MFPDRRLRRLRRTAPLRDLMRETHLHLDDLIYPIFVDEGIDSPAPIPSMPGVMRLPESALAAEIKDVRAAGIKSVILFGVSHHKDAIGSDSWSDRGLFYRMIAATKEAAPDLNVIADICFCEYTDHGHCGVIEDGHVHNDATLDNLGRQALVAARAGADILAPSGMMDGVVRSLRQSLDAGGFSHLPIMSYSTKFSSSFYGPFRDASGITLIGDRKTYQGDPANLRAALLESDQDVAEGADILMVKPGIAYLDIIAKIKERTLLPVGAYQVSGEYAMIKFAAAANAIDEKAVVLETLLAFKRAGADYVITYFAKDIKRYLDAIG